MQNKQPPSIPRPLTPEQAAQERLRHEYSESVAKLLADPDTTAYLFTRIEVNRRGSYRIMMLTATGWQPWSHGGGGAYGPHDLPTVGEHRRALELRLRTDILENTWSVIPDVIAPTKA